MHKFMAKMHENILQKRWVMACVNLGCTTLLLAVALIDHTAWIAAVGFIMAGFMIGSLIHVLVTPGVMTVWHQIEQQNIREQLEKNFYEIVERHNRSG